MIAATFTIVEHPKLLPVVICVIVALNSFNHFFYKWIKNKKNSTCSGKLGIFWPYGKTSRKHLWVFKPSMIVFCSSFFRKLMRSLRSSLTMNVAKRSLTTRLWASSREHLVRIQSCVGSCLGTSLCCMMWSYDAEGFLMQKESVYSASVSVFLCPLTSLWKQIWIQKYYNI